MATRASPLGQFNRIWSTSRIVAIITVYANIGLWFAFHYLNKRSSVRRCTLVDCSNYGSTETSQYADFYLSLLDFHEGAWFGKSHLADPLMRFLEQAFWVRHSRHSSWQTFSQDLLTRPSGQAPHRHQVQIQKFFQTSLTKHLLRQQDFSI